MDLPLELPEGWQDAKPAVYSRDDIAWAPRWHPRREGVALALRRRARPSNAIGVFDASGRQPLRSAIPPVTDLPVKTEIAGTSSAPSPPLPLSYESIRPSFSNAPALAFLTPNIALMLALGAEYERVRGIPGTLLLRLSLRGPRAAQVAHPAARHSAHRRATSSPAEGMSRICSTPSPA
jgi:hypothetical protein